MAFADAYLDKHSIISYNEFTPHPQLQMGIVIPCYREGNLEYSLFSLERAHANCSFPMLIVVVVNSSEVDSEATVAFNRETFNKVQQWSEQHDTAMFRIYPLWVDNIRRKHAGAGYARKVGMDFITAAFNQLDKPDGVIVSLDADTLVDVGYLREIACMYSEDPCLGVATHGFAHPLKGSDLTEKHSRAIAAYELYLRYYKHALAFTGFPFAHYTIGSAFSCRAGLYARQGGMNRRKAGEDFYFLHKLFAVSKARELSSAMVYPSSRVSDRVPFGTGPQIASLLADEIPLITYPFVCFKELQLLFADLPEFYKKEHFELQKYGEAIASFLHIHGFVEALAEMKVHSASESTFKQRFYRWFDAFRCLKLLNYMCEQFGYEKIGVEKAALELTKAIWQDPEQTELFDLLDLFRKKDGVIPLQQ